MPVTTTVTWNPALLNAAIARAYTVSVQEAAGAARKLSHTSKAGVRVVGAGTDQGLAPTGLGTIFEYGRRGGADIEPRNKQALRFRGGKVFAAHVTEGPMRPYPYIRPAAQLWSHGIFQATASGTLAGAGFR